MRIDEIAARTKTLYLMVDYGRERKNAAKVAAKRNIEVFDHGTNIAPMAFGIDPRSYDAERFKDALKTWGYKFKDVTDLWSTKPEVLKSINRGDNDRVAKAFTDRNIETEFKIDEWAMDDEDECTRCLGLKHHPSDSSKKCPECKGTGKCPKAVEEMYEFDDDDKEHGDPTCEWCGGEMQWCPVCDRWTSTCCQEYGTCMCS